MFPVVRPCIFFTIYDRVLRTKSEAGWNFQSFTKLIKFGLSEHDANFHHTHDVGVVAAALEVFDAAFIVRAPTDVFQREQTHARCRLHFRRHWKLYCEFTGEVGYNTLRLSGVAFCRI